MKHTNNPVIISGEEIMNAMWIAEQMHECYTSIIRNRSLIHKMSSHQIGLKADYEFNTYFASFCRELMEYIWLPHHIVKEVLEDIEDQYKYDFPTIFEDFSCKWHDFHKTWMVMGNYVMINPYGDEIHHDERILSTEDESFARKLTDILNICNKAGHDAITRLSA